MTRRRILAVDLGDRRTGLAATDWTGTIAVPLGRIETREVDDCVRQVAALAVDRSTDVIVVGLPLLAGGDSGSRAQRTLEFVKMLRARVSCEVATVDESHTTDEAHQRLKAAGMKASQRKKIADSIAALVILERYRADRDPA